MIVYNRDEIAPERVNSASTVKVGSCTKKRKQPSGKKLTKSNEQFLKKIGFFSNVKGEGFSTKRRRV